MIWQSKPPYGTPLDWDHPWTQGLLAFWAFNDVQSPAPVEMVSGARATAVAGLTWSRDQYGPYAQLTGTTANLSYAGLAPNTKSMSFAGSTSLSLFTGNQMLMQRDNVNATWAVFVTSSTFTIRGANAVARYSTSTGILTAGTRFTWAISDFGPSTITDPLVFGYFNGVRATNTVSGAVAQIAASSSTVRVGNASSVNVGMTGSHSWCAIWNYSINPGMAAQMTASPNAIWQIFQPLSVPLFQPSGGVTATLVRRTLYRRAGSRGAA